MNANLKRPLASALAVSLALGLAACGGMPENRSLYSTKQPVVERTSFALDVNTAADGLPISEQQRIEGWFEAMDLRYGDRVFLDDPVNSGATRDAVQALANRHGVLLTDGTPVTVGQIMPGQARLVLTRSTASVPGCPDWSTKSEMNYTNGTHPGYGCAVNSNMAAMVANPEDLLQGQEGTGETTVTTSTKAIRTYRDQQPTGAQGLTQNNTQGGGN